MAFRARKVSCDFRETGPRVGIEPTNFGFGKWTCTFITNVSLCYRGIVIKLTHVITNKSKKYYFRLFLNLLFVYYIFVRQKIRKVWSPARVLTRILTRILARVLGRSAGSSPGSLSVWTNLCKHSLFVSCITKISRRIIRLDRNYLLLRDLSDAQQKMDNAPCARLHTRDV